MRGRWGVFAGLCAVIATVGLSGCGSDDEKQFEIGTADAYIAIVRWAVAEQSGPPTTGDAKLPVIFIVADEGATIDAGVQAEVAKSTVDDAKVRFADSRDDALDEETDGVPVKDDGVLLITPDIDGDGSARMQVPLVVYTTEELQQPWLLTLTARSTGVEVITAEEVGPAG